MLNPGDHVVVIAPSACPTHPTPDQDIGYSFVVKDIAGRELIRSRMCTNCGKQHPLIETVWAWDGIDWWPKYRLQKIEGLGDVLKRVVAQELADH